jgi:cobalamin biosynthesis Mg chelatase CobN
MVCDRRGVGVAEYALLLFLVVAIAAGTYRFVGGRVKRAGNKTNQQFAQGATSGGSGGQQAAGGADQAGGAANAGATGGGGGSGAGGGGGASQGAAGGGKAETSGASGSADTDDVEAAQKTPLWKIIGAVFLVLFAVGGFFAFRKRKA